MKNKKEPFFNRYMRGEADAADIDESIDEWHSSYAGEDEDKYPPLHEHLGMSKDEFVTWVMASCGQTLSEILKARFDSAYGARLTMQTLGWESHDDIRQWYGRDDGEYGYSIWFTRWDWHDISVNEQVIFHAHTLDLTKIKETVELAANIAIEAWKKHPKKPPGQLIDGKKQARQVEF